MIYLDWAATSPLEPAILDDFQKSWVEDYANASAAHQAGKKVAKKIESARSAMLKLLHASANDQLVFTASATEANNMLIRGLELEQKSDIAYMSVDHPSLVRPLEALAEQKGLKLHDLSVEGAEQLQSISEQTKLVLLSHVNSQNGRILDLEKIIQIIKERAPKAHVHVDAVQSFGKLAIDVKLMQIDSLSLSGHKIGGPKGVGALFIKKGIKITPLLLGGGQEGGLRSSTVAAPLIVALEKISSLKIENLATNLEIVKDLNDQLTQALSEMDGVEFPFHGEQYSPYICCFLLKAYPSDVIMRHLEMEDIYIASTSACSSKIKGYNPTFEKLGIDKKWHKNVLRVSFGACTTEAEIKVFAEKLKDVVVELKGILG